MSENEDKEKAIERMLTKDNLIVTTSWDDGTITDLKLAGLLEKYGIKGTFYILKFIDNPLPKKDIMAIDRKFEIGAHSVSQPDLTKVSIFRAKERLKIQKHLGRPPGYCHKLKEVFMSAKINSKLD